MNDAPRFSWSKCTVCLTVIGALILLWGQRLPGGDIPFVLVGVLLWLLAALGIVLQIGTRIIQQWRGKRTRGTIVHGWRGWRTALLIVIASAILAVFDLPFRIAFALSRPSLERVVWKKGENPRQATPAWVGLFPISGVFRDHETTIFLLNKEDFPWGRRHLCFDPTGAVPPDSGQTAYKRIGQQWYVSHYKGW